tara:strand:+ start:472 stop:813 length:342 start_codon:yes stop_codon:yes gene_type:complete
MATRSVTFSPINKFNTSLTIGDKLQTVVNEAFKTVGTVTDIVEDTTANKIEVFYNEASPIISITSGDFMLFVKNKSINQGSVKGRHATIKIENDSTLISKVTDLSVGITESSK